MAITDDAAGGAEALERRLMRVHLGQDHTADVFIPHYVPRTPRRGDQSVKDTTYTGGEMARIRELAFGAPEGADVQRVLRRQRVEMHAASMERVRGWGNTIMGARKKRLAAQDEKARRLEEERQKVDADWAVLRAKEREEAIRRARMLQHFEEPRVKALHSQLLMSNVLEERDRQKEYKLKYDQANQIREKTDVLKMRLALLDGIEKDRQASERRRAERFDFAAALRHEIQHKESEKRAAKQLESEYYHRVNAAIEREDREVEVARRVVKEQLAKERCSVLAELIAEKEAVKKSAVARARALERENARFNEVKEFHAEKKKEYEAALASEREKLFEIVSQIPTRMDQEAASKLAAYIEKSSHAKDHVDGERRAREQAKHARQLAEQREFQTERRRFVQAQRDAERVAKMQDRRVQMAEADKYERETRELAESRKQVLLGLSAFQAEQIKQNKIAAREAAEAKARADAALAATRDQENAEFDEYAGQLIDEWRAAGKNVAPILMNLERDRPGFVRRRRGDMKTELNTFRRLGVIDSGIVFNLGIVINLKIVTVIGADHFMFHDG